MKMAIAVLASGRGSNLQSLLDSIDRGEINGEIKVVLSDKEGAYALQRAKEHQIEAVWVDPKAYETKAAYEQELLKYVNKYECDLICLAGYMKILGEEFIDHAPCPIMNIHPALLPAFPGLHGQKQALDYGVKVAGATVHFVDGGLDSGPIITQAIVPVYDDDTEDSLSARILEQEHKIYPQAVKEYCEGQLYIVGRTVKRGSQNETCID